MSIKKEIRKFHYYTLIIKHLLKPENQGRWITTNTLANETQIAWNIIISYLEELTKNGILKSRSLGFSMKGKEWGRVWALNIAENDTRETKLFDDPEKVWENIKTFYIKNHKFSFNSFSEESTSFDIIRIINNLLSIRYISRSGGVTEKMIDKRSFLIVYYYLKSKKGEWVSIDSNFPLESNKLEYPLNQMIRDDREEKIVLPLLSWICPILAEVFKSSIIPEIKKKRIMMK